MSNLGNYYGNQEVFFDSDGNLFKHIGRNQIDSETIALIEIVKNSYDADATEVIIDFDDINKPNGEIVVTDNGSGMTFQEFKNYWMCPGTAHKEKEALSPKWKRTMLGRKGMGRFGTDKIGSKVIVKSKAEKEKKSFVATIDANKFEEPDAKFQSTAVPVQFYPKDKLIFVQKNFPVGTQIKMKKLRRVWTKTMVMEVREELKRMISPDNGSTNFSITFNVKDDKELSGKLESNLKDGYSHELAVSVDEKDNYIIKLEDKLLKHGSVITDCIELYTSNSLEYIDDVEIKESFKSFGPLTGRVLYFNTGGLISRASSKHGNRVNHSGVKLYRSGFIVKPYGEKNNDWLKLKAKRNTKGWRYYINADKTMGFINIDPNQNSKLEDTTNRQGLIDNDEKKTFEFFFSEIVIEELNKLLEKESNFQKESNLRKRYQNISRQASDVLAQLKSDLIKEVVRKNNKRKKEQTKKLVVESFISSNGNIESRKTHEKASKEKLINKSANERGKYQKHKRDMSETDRYVIRTIDTWIDGTRWRIRPDDQLNEEMEAWVNSDDQEIVYNISHPMFKAAELSDRALGKSTELGSGIAVQIHIHKSIAVAWGVFHDKNERGTFFERYNEYIQLAALKIKKEKSKFIEDIPNEELENIILN